MANASDYRIEIFQRKPGCWRANVTPVAAPSATRLRTTVLGFVTGKDSCSEADALLAANQAIKELET